MRPLVLSLGESLTPLFQLFFVCFFLAAAIAVVLRERLYARQVFVGGMLAALLVVGIVGLSPLPVTNMHKFSSAGPESADYYRIYIVDEHGDELRYDPQAAKPILNSRLSPLAEKLLTEHDEATRQETAAFLLQHAREYRDTKTQSASLADWVEFPRHGIDYRWSGPPTEYGEFVGIRIYHVQYNTTADGTAVNQRSRERVYEYLEESDS